MVKRLTVSITVYALGSIGAGSDPSRVFKGMRMAIAWVASAQNSEPTGFESRCRKNLLVKVPFQELRIQL